MDRVKAEQIGYINVLNVAKPQPSTTIVDTEAVNVTEMVDEKSYGDSDVDSLGSKLISSSTTSIPTRSEALRGTYISHIFLGRKLPYFLVSNTAHRMWDKFGLYEILVTDKGYFFVKFNTKAQSEAYYRRGSLALCRTTHYHEMLDSMAHPF